MIGRILDGFRRRDLNPGVALGYLGLVALFLWAMALFYIPAKGFSYLIAFGGRQEQSRITKLKKLDYHVERGSDGYDAQYYVQIAMDPSLRNTQLRHAMDSLPYRARRILFPATAYVLGLGEPAWILQAYALLNAITWFALAAVLLHWFPPRNWNNFFRWAGVLASFGVCMSIRNSLVDGPSLLLIAVGLLLAEKGRPGWSTAVLAVSGLGKETNLLAAASFLPKFSAGGRAWGLAVLRGLLVATPLVLWGVYLWMMLGRANDPGARNFDLPFAGYVHKWKEIAGGWSYLTDDNFGPLFSLLMMVSLTVQFLYLVVRPQWEQAWWRVGASFALLLVFLGDAVWEGYPGAASRVLLPMQLAFNILLPAGRGWNALLVAGNLTMAMAFSTLQPPPGDGFELKGKSSLLSTEAGRNVLVDFSPEWYGPERGGSNYWSWAPGTATLLVTNPHPAPLKVRLRFSLSSKGDRQVWVRVNGVEAWRATVSDDNNVSASLSHVTLPPGVNHIEFATDAPAQPIPPDVRKFAFCLHNLRIDLQALDPVPAAR